MIFQILTKQTRYTYFLRIGYLLKNLFTVFIKIHLKHSSNIVLLKLLSSVLPIWCSIINFKSNLSTTSFKLPLILKMAMALFHYERIHRISTRNKDLHTMKDISIAHVVQRQIEIKTSVVFTMKTWLFAWQLSFEYRTNLGAPLLNFLLHILNWW